MQPAFSLNRAQQYVMCRTVVVMTILFVGLPLEGADLTSPNLSVKKLLWAGSGCSAAPDGSASVGDGGKTIAFALPPMVARPAAAGGSLREMRKNCALSMELDYAKDLEFRVIAAELGLGSKGKSLDGLVRIDLRFIGDSTALFQDYEVKGVREAGRLEIRLGQTTWSKCGQRKSFKVQIAARLNKSPPAAEIAESELAVSGPLNLKIEWRACKPK